MFDRKKYMAEYRFKNRVRMNAYAREHRRENPEMYRRHERSRAQYQRGWKWGLRLNAFAALGDKCVRCGYDDPRAFQFNHKNGDGWKDVSSANGHYRMLKDIIAGKRSDIELTCANCNMIHARENNLFRIRENDMGEIRVN